MSEQELICKIMTKDPGKLDEIYAEDAIGQIEEPDLQSQIEEDKKYGKMIPRNGKYFTWEAEDWHGKHITQRQILKGINYAWLGVELEIKIDVRRARPGETPDFKIAFRTVADDPLLTERTIMYHYYPINNIDNPHRGLCVVNTGFPYTVHGNPISMHEIDEQHYPPDTTSTGGTIDFDQTYGHEGPGHGLGLPHSPHKYQLMSNNYSYMSEFADHWTIARWKAKYDPRPWWKKHLYTRFIQWFKKRSDKY